jgi:hypothetical protein
MKWEEEHAGQKALVVQRERELAQQGQLLQHQRETYQQQQQEVRRASQLGAYAGALGRVICISAALISA